MREVAWPVVLHGPPCPGLLLGPSGPRTTAGDPARTDVLRFGVIALGHLVGRRLPIARPGWATAAGVAVVMVLLQALGLIPVLGDLLAIGLSQR